VNGEGDILFQLESIGSFDAQDMLHVPGLKKNLILLSFMEDMGFVVTCHRGQILIHTERDSSDTTVVNGVREGNLYRLQGNPIWPLVHKNDNLCELWHNMLDTYTTECFQF
jgi:hypothetical protein